MRTDIRDFILRDSTLEETSEMIELIKQRRNRLSRMTMVSLAHGDTVEFTSSRSGQRITGRVDSIKVKNVIVSTALGRYRVPANMLRRVDQ